MKEKKIVILSTDSDMSTTYVMRWIGYLRPDIQVVRLHPEDLINGTVNHNINDSNLEILAGNKRFSICETGAVWTRKWDENVINISSCDKGIKSELTRIKQNLQQEYNEWCNYIIYLLQQNSEIYWLNQPRHADSNKLIQLKLATLAGLKTPQSHVSNKKTPVINNKSFITKSLSNCMGVKYENKLYNNYTCRITSNSNYDDLFISYFQEEIPKHLELRVFYLAGSCYAIAIHSQGNNQTDVDYRRYDLQHGNRNEYYQLPDSLEQQIDQFMHNMNLKTGSLDFILTPKGDYIFLEVNPSGQYDIFNSCNVYPDKLIAEHLINNL